MSMTGVSHVYDTYGLRYRGNFKNSTVNNCEISNTFTGNIQAGTNNTNGVDTFVYMRNITSYNSRDDSISINDMNKNVFENIKVYNNTGNGFNTSNSEYNLFNNLQSYNNKKNGFALGNGSLFNALTNAQTYNNAQIGIVLNS